ncbi:uncharacterized protein MYCFIDRAFT_171197 [Pseudocercospora fijiensis CIRAD86]|uniref:Uncharacterized protein n=1 Tax=Pseudocercospora fijiensis (strain CIRAD86) TaxID=383855 RepID=M3B7I0_PSEFD|nr:uncharacterized protein MYCFIDRAFT_171197 [Pseudocercospora fijiensis CIRAD86]EME85257.1 hypothetical protein MYCFIDRAFT_171197 [Pseudocercospora fijiensis CIRAD86]
MSFLQYLTQADITSSDWFHQEKQQIKSQTINGNADSIELKKNGTEEAFRNGIQYRFQSLFHSGTLGGHKADRKPYRWAYKSIEQEVADGNEDGESCCEKLKLDSQPGQHISIKSCKKMKELRLVLVVVVARSSHGRRIPKIRCSSKTPSLRSHGILRYNLGRGVEESVLDLRRRAQHTEDTSLVVSTRQFPTGFTDISSYSGFGNATNGPQYQLMVFFEASGIGTQSQSRRSSQGRKAVRNIVSANATRSTLEPKSIELQPPLCVGMPAANLLTVAGEPTRAVTAQRSRPNKISSIGANRLYVRSRVVTAINVWKTHRSKPPKTRNAVVLGGSEQANVMPQAYLWLHDIVGRVAGSEYILECLLVFLPLALNAVRVALITIMERWKRSYEAPHTEQLDNPQSTMRCQTFADHHSTHNTLHISRLWTLRIDLRSLAHGISTPAQRSSLPRTLQPPRSCLDRLFQSYPSDRSGRSTSATLPRAHACQHAKVSFQDEIMEHEPSLVRSLEQGTRNASKRKVVSSLAKLHSWKEVPADAAGAPLGILGTLQKAFEC